MWRRRNPWMLCALLTVMPLAQRQHVDAQQHDEGPPLTLRAAVDEAFARNLDLIALRRRLETARLRPGQEQFLAPPILEAQIWQWPLNTINPWNTNMYMFMVSQEIPGGGKRALRTAVVEKDTYRELVSPNDVEAYALPDPEPEERTQYWEFRDLK